MSLNVCICVLCKAVCFLCVCVCVCVLSVPVFSHAIREVEEKAKIAGVVNTREPYSGHLLMARASTDFLKAMRLSRMPHDN